jgi:hypothetical protein
MFGAGLICLGMLGLVIGASFPAWSRTFFTISLVIVGTGMGPASLSFILAVQQAVSWGQRGVATGAVIFFRTIGGAIGVGILGGALGWELGRLLVSSGASGTDVGAALRPETHSLLSPASLALVQSNLGISLRDVYLQMFALALGILACTAWLPGKAARARVARHPASEVREGGAELVEAASSH